MSPWSNGYRQIPDMQLLRPIVATLATRQPIRQPISRRETRLLPFQMIKLGACCLDGADSAILLLVSVENPVLPPESKHQFQHGC